MLFQACCSATKGLGLLVVLVTLEGCLLASYACRQVLSRHANHVKIGKFLGLLSAVSLQRLPLTLVCIARSTVNGS
jgi:hypothetical protein